VKTYDGKIEKFAEVFEWISYDYEKHYPLKKIDDDTFVVNKLTITRTELSYKTEFFELAPGLFEKVFEFWRLFQDENSIRFIGEG
jgi:hypothetical protein